MSQKAIKFFTILRTFSPEELKSFEIWLNSSWCNSNKNLSALLKHTKKYHPTFELKKLSKEKLFRKILPTGKFSDRRMNNILSEGFLAAEKFLIFNNLHNDHELQKKLIIKEHALRKLDEWFMKESTKEITRLEEKEVKDWEDHLSLLIYHRQIYRQPSNKFRQVPGSQLVIKMSEALNLFHLLELAALINEKIFRNRLLQNENHEISNVLNHWRGLTKGVENISLNLYHIRFEYNEDNLIEKFNEYKETLFRDYKLLNTIDQKLHYYSLTNDISYLVKRRLFEVKDLLPIFKFGLNSEILIENGMITEKVFTSIVFSSNVGNDHEWTLKFIDKYWNRLSSKNKSSAREWAYAHTEYNRGEVKKALDILVAHDFKTFYYLRMTKMLSMQCYFDLFLRDETYHTFLFNLFDSYEKYLSRDNNQSIVAKKSWIQMVQKARMLAKYFLEEKFQKDKVENLLQEVGTIQAPGWLTRKIKQIISLREKN